MILDITTQTIAHFVGLFHIAIEEARVRLSYRPFDEEGAPAEDFDPIDASTPRVSFTYDLEGFNPGVAYFPLGWTVENVFSQRLSLDPITVRVPPVDMGRRDADYATEFDRTLPDRLMNAASMTIDPPGSVVAIIVQTISLSDNDALVVGHHGLSIADLPDGSARLASIFDTAASFSPLADLRMRADSVDDLISLIDEADALLRGFEPPSGEDHSIFMLKAPVIEGLYVNGVLSDETPDFDLYRPVAASEAETVDPMPESFDRGGRSGDEPPSEGHSVRGERLVSDGMVLDTSVEIVTGDNLLLNTVRLSNEWLASSVFAVGGDHIELNAVIQINAWQDIDHLGGAVADWARGAGDPTLGFNIAKFTRVDLQDRAADEAPAAPSFPKAWIVTELTGDLVILNWIEQFSFMLDQDIAVMSAFGSKVTAILGDNGAGNEITLNELGLYYDLVFVGGSLYDVNLLQQMNVLLDNDLVAGVGGFATSGEGSVANAGNLLWNQANIVQIGGADRFSQMPDAFREALANLQSGGTKMPGGVLNDPAFAGLEGLRVLYITGDILNLQYLKQTNVLGDSDQIVLAMDALANASSANWTITSGANTLVNVASIVDVDGTGKTYVGGDTYSDEILIQAEFLPSDPWLAARDPNALVSEAVVFLGDDMLDGHDMLASAPYGAAPVHAPHPDVMHTMLA